MLYAFIDESGDLGFGKGASKWFVFAMVIVPDKRSLERIAKKVYRSLTKRGEKIGELHAHRMSESTRRKMIRMIASSPDIRILSVVLEKDHVLDALKKDPDALYARMARMLIVGLIFGRSVNRKDPIRIIIDRKNQDHKLDEELLVHMEGPLSIAGFMDMSVSSRSSETEKSLQVADFISWAIFRKYEMKDESFYGKISFMIEYEEMITLH